MNFLGQGMNIFLGLLGVHVNLIFVQFPLVRIFVFWYFARPHAT